MKKIVFAVSVLLCLGNTAISKACSTKMDHQTFTKTELLQTWQILDEKPKTNCSQSKNTKHSWRNALTLDEKYSKEKTPKNDSSDFVKKNSL